VNRTIRPACLPIDESIENPAAGNAYDALKDITAISREQKRVGLFSGPAHLPYVQAGKLSVVAK
jgi:hypothetical protein